VLHTLKSTFTALAAQLELAFEPSQRATRPAAPPRDDRGALLLETLHRLGLRETRQCRLTRNRRVMVSHRAGVLRVHESFAAAPDQVLRAIATFVTRRGAARREARRVILAYPVETTDARRRSPRMHPDDARLGTRLTQAHELLNREHFGGQLRALEIRVSRRMRSRLGHYLPAKAGSSGEIVISRRHVRRDGWQAVLETLLHEMVHQWQDEEGLAVDHGREFRRKARAVGIAPSARRRANDGQAID
jgi:hypothetical protein